MAMGKEKEGALAKMKSGVQKGTTRDAAIVNTLPRPEKVSALLTGQSGKGGPRPHVLIPINIPPGTIIKKDGLCGIPPERDRSE